MAPLHRVYFLGTVIQDPAVWTAPNGTAVARWSLAVPTRRHQEDPGHADVRGARSASSRRATSITLSSAASTIRRSSPWLRMNDQSRLTARTYCTCLALASDQGHRWDPPRVGATTGPSADDRAPVRT